MRSKWILILLMFSLAVNVAALVTMAMQWSKHSGRNGPPSRPPFSENHREMLRRRLDLTDEQYERVARTQDQFAKEMEALQTSLGTKRDELFLQLEAQEPNREQVEVLLQEIATLQADQERKVVGNLLNMKDVLTPEQREKLHSLLDRRFGGPRGHFGPRGRQGERPGDWQEREPFRPE